ncbi:MAG: hypothetical protein IJM15_03485 [Erysipelotrichaceae bacterium]|nr:hypothetical protein [Erysipelotrichaceae bacterium]
MKRLTALLLVLSIILSGCAGKNDPPTPVDPGTDQPTQPDPVQPTEPDPVSPGQTSDYQSSLMD